MHGTRRGLVAPQNTFLENIVRRSSGQHSSFLLANAQIVNYPIVYCNDGFCKLSGFSRAEVMQKGSLCSFMHGERTDPETVEKIRDALESWEQVQIEVLLYKKNKTPLWLLEHIAPIKNEKDQVVLFLLTFKDITALKQPIAEDDGKGLSKFARLAKSVTRNKSVMLQFSTQIPNAKADPSKPSSIGHLMNLSSDVLPQYRQEAPKTPPHIILHYCAFKATWDWIILALTFYTAVMVPYNVAFRNKTMDGVPLLVVDSIVDVVFFIDIILNFHTTFVGPAGEVVSEPKIVRMNYLKSWFVIDLLSCLPYDVFNAFQHVDDGISSIFSALKVVRLLRLGRVARKLDHYLEYGAAVLVLFLFCFVLSAHWLACIWYTIGYYETGSGIKYSWLSQLANLTQTPFSKAWHNQTDELVGGPTKGEAYVTALYYTLSCMTSVGFGNVAAFTEAEKIFTILMMIIGSILYAVIFGNVTTMIQQLMSSTARYHEMLNSVREFMKLHDIPKSLSERVMDYVVSTWAVTKGIDTAKVLNYCPKDMRADICVHLNRQVFNEHPAFRLASDGCLRALAMHFTMQHSAPGDIIFHQGESLDLLCFLVSGSLEVVQDDEVVAILSKGDVFGDLFWKEATIGQAMANVRGLTYCDLHIIKRDRLLEVLDFYHAFANSFARNLTLTYNLRHRIVFRKVIDVKREQELAEKRKNDPSLDLSNNHPVRKLISRFRKIEDQNSDKSQGHLSDPESGPMANNHTDSRPNSATRVINVTESPTPMSNLRNNANKLTKWQKFLNNPTEPQNSSVHVNEIQKQPDKPEENGRKNSAPKLPNRVSKWGKFLGNKEPIEESNEEGDKSALKKSDSRDSGILQSQSDQKLDQLADDAVSKEGEGSSRVETLTSFSVVEQQLISSLYDIKLEIKEEIENLNTKMTKIDVQIADILKMFSPHSSPYTTQTHSSSSSRMSSSKGSVTSPETSPKHRSPRTSLEMPVTAIGATGRTIKSPKPLRKPSTGSIKSSKNYNSSVTGSQYSSSSLEPDTHSDTTSADISNNTSGTGTPRNRVKTRAKPPPSTADDEENIPIKDRDLDIL